MPELSPLRTKVDVDTTSLDTAAAKMEVFSHEVDRKLEPAGQAWIKYGERGELASVRISSATARNREDLDNLTARAQRWAADTDESFRKGSTAMLRLGDDGSTSLRRLSSTTEESHNWLVRLGAKFGELGQFVNPATAGLLALAAAISLTVAPAIVYLLGVTSALLVGGSFLAGFAAIGAGAIALTAHYKGWTTAGEDLTKAQAKLAAAQDAVNDAVRPTRKQLEDLKDAQAAYNAALERADNPLTRLLNNINAMGSRLADRAVPAVASLLEWIEKAIPAVERLASKLLDWFTERLPQIKPIVERILADFLDVITDVGRRLGLRVDDWIKHPEQFEKAFKEVLFRIDDAIIGLIHFFNDISNWWSEHHEEIARDAEMAFGAMGTAVRIAVGAFMLLEIILDGLTRALSTVESWANRVARAFEWAARAKAAFEGKGGGGAPGGPGGGGPDLALQHGGTLPPGRWARVGEVASELLYAKPGGGAVVVPESGGERKGGQTINVTINAANMGQIDERQLVAILRRYVQLYG